MNDRILSNLRTNLKKFFDDMKNRFPTEPSFVIASLAIENQFPMEDAIGYIKEYVLPVKDKILQKDEQFFLSGNKFLSKLNPTSVDGFRDRWLQLSKDDKEVVWRYFEVFVKLAERYD